MIKKLMCALLAITAQSNFCMDAEQPVAGNPPNDGQEWIEVKSSGNLYHYESDHGQFKDFPKFGNPGKLAAVSLGSGTFSSDSKQPEWFAMPHQRGAGIYYARIRETTIEVLSTKYIYSIGCRNGIKHISPAFIRGLTLPEMKEILKGNVLFILCRSFREEIAENWNNTMEHFDEVATTHAAELEDMKQKYKTLRNLNSKEQRNYVLNNSCIVTLLGIRARRQSTLSMFPKDVLRDYILRPLIALETERISKMPLNLEQPKSEQPQ